MPNRVKLPGYGAMAGYSKAAAKLPHHFSALFSFTKLGGGFEFINSVNPRHNIPMVELLGYNNNLDWCIVQHDNEIYLACGTNKLNKTTPLLTLKNKLCEEQVRLTKLAQEHNQRKDGRVGSAGYPSYKISERDDTVKIVTQCLADNDITYYKGVFYSEQHVQKKFKELGYTEFSAQFLIIKPPKIKSTVPKPRVRPIFTTLRNIPVIILDRIDKDTINYALALHTDSVASTRAELQANLDKIEKCINSIKL